MKINLISLIFYSLIGHYIGVMYAKTDLPITVLIAVLFLHRLFWPWKIITVEQKDSKDEE